MFDNVIGHKETVALLTAQLGAGSFPRAVLFHGPAYSGKLSTALEAARALCCLRRDAEWGCPCPSCDRHRSLTHPDLLLLGPRYFDVEMAASADAFRRTGVQAARYLFVRAVRKLLRRFDPVLWDAESAEGRKVLAQVAAAEDAIEALPAEGSSPERLEKAARVVVESASRLLDNFRTPNIPVQQIRRLAQWAHLAPSISRKVAIIEGAEAINDSSRSALLKLLEEPPEGVTLIVTAVRRGAIIPTILSRLRPYHFAERPPEEQADVLRRIFREEAGEYPLLRDYFLAWKALNPNLLRALAGRFVALLAGGGSADGSVRGLIDELAQGEADSEGAGSEGTAPAARRRGLRPEAFRAFCEELLADLRGRLADEKPGLLALERWTALVRETAEFARLYNPDPALQLESLYYRMRAAS